MLTERLPPKFLFLQTNQRCNLRCTHCFYWKQNDDDAPNYLPLVRRREVIAEFADLGGQALVTCGGEPMLDLDDYFALMGAAREHGLRALSVVNGTRIKTHAMAERMIESGPTEITVSLDHWHPTEHDRLRGVQGSWRAAVTALELLIDARRKLQSATPIYVMTILSEDTWRTLSRFYELVLEYLGADKLKLNVLQPSFQGRGPDEYFKHARVTDVAACMDTVRFCDAHWRIPRNPEWLRVVENYLSSTSALPPPLLGWQNPEASSEAICNSYDRNIMVDLYGRARLCFSHSYPAVLVSRLGDLTRFWHERSLPIREKMIGCKQFCGISHSVRKEPSLIRRS